MTYNEWRDELKSNLLCVSDAERRRVLDYYAEAYADRREAGFSEREIIDDFGAPYDAAQRILNESVDEEPKDAGAPKGSAPPPRREEKDERAYDKSASPPPPSAPRPVQKKETSALFIILCIVFCVPLFGLVMALAGITFGLCVSPFALIISGAASTIGSMAMMASGDIAYGCYILGGGLIEIGIGIIVMPFVFKLVKLIWKTFRRAVDAVRNVLSGKEQTV